VGFAKIALAAKCPVIPMFTSNVREAFRTVSFFRRVCEPIYARFKLPLMPIYGGFPVKMTSYIGNPVEYDPETCTPEQLRDKCRDALKELIDNHQKRPGSIVRALYQRVRQETNHVS
jgi:1-acyl-sn-glycerol-3-phosphate acyltransferase